MLDKLKDIVKVRTRDVQWVIGYRKKSKSTFLYDGNYETQFTIIRPTIRYWFGDPIINKINGKEYLFCEMYDVVNRKGAIGISYRDKNGKWSKPKKIIGGKKQDQHLSFPIVIKWKENYYMFPCIGNGIIQVYKMGEHECKWNLWCELFDDHYYVDTIFEIFDEHLYMISGVKDINDSMSTKLSINEIHNLEVRNRMEIMPAILEGASYEYSTRNAGKLLYTKNGNGSSMQLRVTQESDKINGYGYNLQFRRFSLKDGELNESLYYRISRDKILTDIDKSIWFETIGPHTYSQSESDEIIDIKVKAFSIIYIIRYFTDNIKRIFNGKREKNG